MARVFSGSGDRTCLEMKCPKNFSFSQQKLHFALLTRSKKTVTIAMSYVVENIIWSSKPNTRDYFLLLPFHPDMHYYFAILFYLSYLLVAVVIQRCGITPGPGQGSFCCSQVSSRTRSISFIAARCTNC